jgi:hypothetical protein
VIYIGALLAGLVAAVGGYFVTGFTAGWIAGLFGMSDFEGGRGMFAFLVVGPIGGLVAMIATIWAVLRAGRGRGSLGGVAGVLAALVAIVGAGIAVRLWTVPTYSNEAPPSLEFELRFPSAMLPADTDVGVELHTDHNVGPALVTTPWPPVDGGQQVIAGVVSLDFKTTSRLLVVTVPGEPVRLFRLGLSRDPSSTPSLGDWQHAAHLDRGGETQPEKAPADDPVELRYRVRRAGED